MYKLIYSFEAFAYQNFFAGILSFAVGHDFLLLELYKIHFLSPVNLWKLIKNKDTELICII